MENFAAKSLPFNSDAELSVLGAMFLDAACVPDVLNALSDSDFYVPRNKEIFEAIANLSNSGKPVDMVTLAEELRLRGLLEKIGGVDYLVEALSFVPSSVGVLHYAKIVKDKSILRDIIRATAEISEVCYAEKNEVEDVLGFVEKKLFQIAQCSENKSLVHIKDLLEENLDRFAKIAKSDSRISGLPTGFADLDQITFGLHPADLILVAARPAMGKTSFVLNIAQHAAIYENATVALFSLEMPALQIANRMLSCESMINSGRLRNGDIYDDDWPKIGRAMEPLCRANIYIDDTFGITVPEISSKCRKLKLEKGLNLIIVDYLQLMSSQRRIENRQQEISEISRSMKILAGELNVPIILLSQLSRAPETRTDHRPILSDLRESGAIEQDADIVMFLYREDYYDKECEEQNVAECIIAKHRNGELGTVKLTWLSEFTKFTNWSGMAE
jgi:replicative DNA helicase